MHDVALKLAVVAAGGILAQWVAWRTSLPAIVLLLVGGFVLGPLTGWLDPAADFGEAYRPVVSIAVAIILFEGGLTLDVAEIRETSKAVRRLILLGGPLVWGMTALAEALGQARVPRGRRQERSRGGGSRHLARAATHRTEIGDILSGTKGTKCSGSTGCFGRSRGSCCGCGIAFRRMASRP